MMYFRLTGDFSLENLDRWAVGPLGGSCTLMEHAIINNQKQVSNPDLFSL